MAYKASCLFLCVFLVSLQPSSSFSSLCPLPWNANSTFRNGINKQVKCPYGTLLPGDVTLPKDADFMIYICVIYGYMPFLVVIFSVVECCVLLGCHGSIGTRELSFLLFVVCVVIVNEIIFKQVASVARPDHSCNYTCGMPSGHATMANGFFMLLLLDSVFRVTPKTAMTIEAAKKEIEDKSCRNVYTKWQLFRRIILPSCTKRFWTTVPLSSLDVISHREFTFLILLWGILLLPVTISRVIIEDHTPSQVAIGCWIGVAEACIWFALVRLLQKRYNHKLGERVCMGITHNYAVPRFEVRSKCVHLLAWSERQSRTTVLLGAGDAVPVTPKELKNMCAEIDWYMQLTHENLMREESNTEHEFLDLEMSNLRPLYRQVTRELSRIIALLEENGHPGSTELSQDFHSTLSLHQDTQVDSGITYFITESNKVDLITDSTDVAAFS